MRLRVDIKIINFDVYIEFLFTHLQRNLSSLLFLLNTYFIWNIVNALTYESIRVNILLYFYIEYFYIPAYFCLTIINNTILNTVA